MSSIRRQLLIWLLAGFSAATVVAAIGVYRQARIEVREIFDFQLRQMAYAFPNGGFGALAGPNAGELDIDDVVVVQIWDASGEQLYLSRPGAPPPESADLGFSSVDGQSGRWRVYSALLGDYVIQVSQPTSMREKLAAEVALRTMQPLLVLLPVLLALVWFTVGRGLRPLDEVATAVGARSAAALQPLPEHPLPVEVKPLVVALNDLLARLGRALGMQRAFIADAAHELRTPLTALRLQIQVAERASPGDERDAAFSQLKAGIDRATRLVEQLLTLARNEPETADRTLATIDLAAIARHVLAERAPIAEAKNIDIGLTADGPVSVAGDPEALRIMLGNLIDNSIRYSPAGGAIDVKVQEQDGTAQLEVTDSGPGIPPADRERVFDRFYRGEATGVPGSGLGLAIVRQIVQRHGASIALGEGSDGRGLKVQVQFPLHRGSGADSSAAAS